MNRSVVVVLVVLAIIVAAVLVGPSLMSPGSKSGTVAPPAAAPKLVAALGRIEPELGVINVGADATRRVNVLLVKEGQTVAKNEVLAQLDNYLELQSAFSYAESQLKGGSTQLKFRSALEEANIAKAAADLKSIDELAASDLALKEIAVEKSRLDLELTEREAKRLERLVGQGSASREDVDKKNNDVVQKSLQLKSDQAELARRKTQLELDRTKAKASLDAAKANLDLYKANIDVDSLAKNLEQVKEKLNSGLVRAPEAGQILKIRSRAGELVSKDGLLTLADVKNIWVVAEVYENDLLRIRPGQTARITSPALPEALTGKVELVGRLISKQTAFDLDPKAATDARVGEVRIRLDRIEEAARLINLQVTVQIDVGP